MLRLGKKISTPMRRKVNVLWSEQKLAQSSHSGHKSKGLGKGLIFFTGTTSIVGGLIGYSAWSGENRKFIEESIPGSQYLLEPFLGPTQESIPKSLPSSLSKSAHQGKKKLEKISEKPNDISEKSSSSLPLLPPPPTIEPIKQLEQDQNTVSNSTDSKSELSEPALTPLEKKTVNEKEVLSQILTEKVRDAQSLITDALSLSERVVQTVRNHAEKAYAAIDSGEGDESLYAMAAEVAKAKKDIIKTTEEKLQLAKEKVEDLQREIAKGRSSNVAKDNSDLSAAEESYAELSYAISKVKSSLAEALRDSSVVNEFRDLVQASRTQFEAEVRSLLPDVNIGERSDKLTPDELNLLLAHAHRKVLALQKALAKQQTIDKERFKESVLRQREMETKLIDGKLNSELEKQRRDLTLEHRHRLQQLREDLEAELRTQLKRQAAAHSDHLGDVLDQQEKSLEEKWHCKFNEELQSASDEYIKSLSRIQGELSGIKNALKSRSNADKAAHSSHDLWLACESLKMALRFGKTEAGSWEDQLLPLENHIQSIKKASGENDPFVNLIVSHLPEVALNRGVFTDEALKERFMKVDRICRKVALIGENGAALPRYFLSYLQSIFLVGAFDRIPETEMLNEEFDSSKLNAYDVLARARYCIAKDDFLQAVRYLNLLRGEPRNVASDWLKETKRSLEVKQAADALMAHAAATGARAL